MANVARLKEIRKVGKRYSDSCSCKNQSTRFFSGHALPIVNRRYGRLQTALQAAHSLTRT